MPEHALPPLSALLSSRDDPHGHRDVVAAAKAALAAAKARNARPRSTFVPPVRVDAPSGPPSPWRVRVRVLYRRRMLIGIVIACCIVAAFIVFHRGPPSPARHVRAAASSATPNARPALVERAIVHHAQPVARSAATAPIFVHDGRHLAPGDVSAWLANLTPARIAAWYATPKVAPVRHLVTPAPPRAVAPAPVQNLPAMTTVAHTTARRPAHRVQAVASSIPAPARPVPRVAVRPANAHVSAPVGASRLTTLAVPTTERASRVPAHATPAAARVATPAPTAPEATAYHVVTFVNSNMVLIQSTRDGKTWVSAYSVGQRLPDGRVLTAVNLARHTISTGR